MPERGHHRLVAQCALGPLRLNAALEFATPWTLIFGPSGSGKSSLLRAMCGLLACPSVEFWRDEEKVAARADRRGLGFAPQHSMLFPHLSVTENVGFGGGSAALMAEMLDLFVLTAFAARMPRELSGGERQRVNLARAFAVPGAKLLLLDEPFSGVDRGMRDELLPRMQAWAAGRGVPVISVSHDVEEALLLGAEVVRLEQGSVVAQGPAADVLCDERARMLAVLG